jgi:hypothetical protein
MFYSWDYVGLSLCPLSHIQCYKDRPQCFSLDVITYLDSLKTTPTEGIRKFRNCVSFRNIGNY